MSYLKLIIAAFVIVLLTPIIPTSLAFQPTEETMCCLSIESNNPDSTNCSGFNLTLEECKPILKRYNDLPECVKTGATCPVTTTPDQSLLVSGIIVAAIVICFLIWYFKFKRK